MTGASEVTYQSANDTGSTTAAMPAASANHFSCWRSTPCARRKRRTSDAAAASSAAIIRVTPAPNSAPVGSPSTANGLCPLGKSYRSSSSDQPTIVNTVPTAATQTAERHLRLGRRPSGISRNVRIQHNPLGCRPAEASNSAVSPPSHPRSVACNDQPCAASAMTAPARAKTRNNQPIGFRGCREATSAPAPARVAA